MKLRIKGPADYINNVINFRKSVFDKIADKNDEPIWLKASLGDVKNVTVINAAPRSGSSLLFAILKRIPQFYSLSGESTPFYKLNGLCDDTFSSDEIPERLAGEETRISGMSREFLYDFSSTEDKGDIFNDNDILDRYLDDLVLRFPLQWPQIPFSYSIFRKLAAKAFDTYARITQEFCKEEFYLELLWFLRGEYKTINPYYYDIQPAMIKNKFPALEVPLAPPHSLFTLEEPPFILLSPARKVDRDDLAKKSLLLKSSADCYRMSFIEKLFPNADIKIIYLVRNPAASVNGLYDGWLHRGFFSHNLKTEILNISGYSDRYEWGKRWWNYDLPPGWQDYAQNKLEEVCVFQWYSANKAIQEYLNKSRKRYCLVRYENIIRDLASREREIGGILNLLGLSNDWIREMGLDNLPVVQATEAPLSYRWKKREDIILPLLDAPGICEMSAGLGYNKDDMKEWL